MDPAIHISNLKFSLLNRSTLTQERRGSDYVSGALNWGPLTWLNAGWETLGWWWLRRGGFDRDFHTYALEWDQDFMCTLLQFFLLFDSDFLFRPVVFMLIPDFTTCWI